MSRRRRALEHLAEDIRAHIEEETRDNIELGMAPDEARAAALRRFGNVTRVMEETRAVWEPVWLQDLTQDLRFGWRMLRRNPAFALALILTLALGIGLNAAVFSLVNVVLLRPLPYPHAERLVWLANYYPMLKAEIVTGVDFLEWKAEAKCFEEVAAYGVSQQILATKDGDKAHSVATVTADFWKLSGARPALGGLFAGGEREALVLADALFERRFGRDPGVIGRAVALNGRAFTIVGVLPPEFRFVLPQPSIGMERGAAGLKRIEAYVLNPIEPGSEVRGGAMTIQQVVASLKPGVSLESARAELEGIQSRIASRDATAVRVMPLRDKLSGEARWALVILLAAVGFVLLIACANISSLLLARAVARRKEIAIRIAIGAGRSRLMRLFAAESIVLGLIGGVAGLAFARLSLGSIVRLAPQAIPRLEETSMDWRVLLFALGVTLAAVALFGLAPALSLSRSNVFDDLKQGSKTSTSGIGGLSARQLLVAGQIALSIVLLTAAGLAMKSFWLMHSHPPGFAPDRTLLLRLNPDRPPDRDFFEQLLDRMNALPGVEAAGMLHHVAGGPIEREGAVADRSRNATMAAYSLVSAGFGRVLGLPLVRGRWLTDREGGPVVMINETYARLVFGGENPIGQRIMVEALLPPPRTAPATVVGVTADLRYTKLDARPGPEVYIPYRRAVNLPSASLLVRTSANAAAVAVALRQVTAQIDRAQATAEIETLGESLAESIAPRRFHLSLLGSFAAAALFLASVGIYGSIAYSVSRRTREIGVRLALGAPTGEIVRMVVGRGMRVVLAGILVGLSAALGLTRSMASLLFEVGPADPATFAAVAVLLTVTALAAMWIPARRAARVDPLVALRSE